MILKSKPKPISDQMPLSILKGMVQNKGTFSQDALQNRYFSVSV
jgi:hypothetical protein